MKKSVLNIMFVSVLLLCSAAYVFAQERPKLKELNDKRYEQALNGVSPWEKKGAYGYADEQGKFFIPPVFRSVMPMGMHNAGFVSYFSTWGFEVWTPISLKGVYLTELEFDKVVKNFDDRGLAVVRQEGKYGVINHTGKMVANCIYTNFADKEQVYLLYSKSGGCVAIAKDKSEKGYSAYSFAGNEQIVVKAEGGYGIISPKNYFVVADFEYDSVRELIPNAAYCLQKDGKKYLYAGEKLSHGYEDVIPGYGKSYFVVKQNGKYGVVSTQNATLLACTQDEMPVLKKGEYSCFYEHGAPVYLTVDRRVTPTEYDNYLIKKHKDSFADYLLETTLDYGSKQYIGKVVAALYGTKDFARIQHLPEAVEYAESRRFILLSKDNENAKFFDLSNGRLLNADEILYHAFPSKSGAPAYASCLRDGKFGIIDIRNKKTVLPFEYDKIKSLEKGYVSLQKGEAYYLYNVTDSLLVTPSACTAIDHFSIAGLEFICVEQDGTEKLFNPNTHHWILPDTERLDGIVPVLGTDGNLTDLAAVMKKDSKGALYSIRSGERLTDYLFEDVDQELFAGKYYMVTAGGKKGLYDLAAKKYVLACLYDEIKDYYKYNGDEFAVVMKAKKCGLHNITKNKLVVTVQNDEIEVKGGYASIRRGVRYAVQSLKTNQMVFESPVFDFILMDDGYGLLKTPEMNTYGIYNLNWNEWRVDPIWNRNIDYLGGDLVVMEGRGLVNYKTDDLLFSHDVDLSCGAYEVIGDYFMAYDAIEGYYAGVYKISKGTCVVETIGFKFLSSDITRIPNRNFAILQDWEIHENEPVRLLHCALFDLENERNLLRDSYDGNTFTDMDYWDGGLIRISMSNNKTGLYDLVTGRWVCTLDGEVSHEVKGVYMILSNAGENYIFDRENRGLLLMSENFSLNDYIVLKNMGTNGYYKPRPSKGGWCLYDSEQNRNVTGPFDRISLMYEPK